MSMSDRRRAPIFLLALCACSQADRSIEDHSQELGPDFFTNEIQPILKERCFECHGPQKKRVKGGLRIDGPDALLRGGNSGPAVNPDDPDASLLLTAIRYEDPDLAMPPMEPLPAKELALLERWVAAGIPWTEPERTPADIEDAHFFEQQVRPILAERCFECHGPEQDRKSVV